MAPTFSQVLSEDFTETHRGKIDLPASSLRVPYLVTLLFTNGILKVGQALRFMSLGLGTDLVGGSLR